MKFLCKLAIINLLFISVYAKDDFKIYKQYADYLLNDTVNLPNNLKDPFLGLKIRKYKKVQIAKVQKDKPKKTIKKVVKIKKHKNLNIKILAICMINNKKEVVLKVNSIKKTIKEGEPIIDDYKLQKIINSNTILVSNKNKTKIVRMNKNNINIKVIK